MKRADFKEIFGRGDSGRVCAAGEPRIFCHHLRGGKLCMPWYRGYRFRWSLNPRLFSGSPSAYDKASARQAGLTRTGGVMQLILDYNTVSSGEKSRCAQTRIYTDDLTILHLLSSHLTPSALCIPHFAPNQFPSPRTDASGSSPMISSLIHSTLRGAGCRAYRSCPIQQ
jgi:hypothetical protein